ncbi:MAG: endolytic transglycosylase MltG [bacterium]
MRIFKEHIFVIYSVLLAVLILVVGIAAKIFIPVEIPRDGSVIVHIDKGQSLISISHELEKEQIIDSPFLFRLIITLRGSENSIPAGYYLFSDDSGQSGRSRYSLSAIARRLAQGEMGFRPQKITIPEGLNVIDIGNKVHQEFPAIDALEFASSAKPYEGYLFPDTYLFMPYATSGEIIHKMRDTFEQKVTDNPLFAEAIASSTHSFADIIKMASILEGEVRTLEDRKIVSDLLWRRIKKGMPLQVDSTFKYINQKTSAQLTLGDLKIDSLYNTYKYKGLPPTPISNPGLETLFAAAEPTPNQYVFFLNDKDGISHFAKTFAEHIRYKNQYLK